MTERSFRPLYLALDVEMCAPPPPQQWTPTAVTPTFDPRKSCSSQTRKAGKRTRFWPWPLKLLRAHMSKCTSPPSLSSNRTPKGLVRSSNSTHWTASICSKRWRRRGSLSGTSHIHQQPRVLRSMTTWDLGWWDGTGSVRFSLALYTNDIR